ncbi:MAG: hypothetical protein EA406_13265 [Rhodospirillales bacterium]|nr:MAG: hypothetical protein EA406_13265 [Rhodospirillales bacterium]
MHTSSVVRLGVRWSNTLKVGIPALDADRRCLVRVISLLQGIRDADEARTMVTATLETLGLYARFHFAREERVLEAFNYPGLELHRSEHQAFAADLERLRRRFGGRADRKAAALLQSALAERLAHHVLLYDMDYRAFIDDPARAEQIARSGCAESLLSLDAPRRPCRRRPRVPQTAAVAML